MICARRVFCCFKWLERIGDRITGACGPYFVGGAVILISLGVICFFDVILPSLAYPWLTTPICILIAVNLLVHYYYVCTIPPGFVDVPTPEAGTSLLWAKKRKTQRHSGSSNGVIWSASEEGALNITKAAVGQCRKCGQAKPERTHHCRICNRCVLKYDHHCPVRINQCVGLYNERHFVMFMAYLVLATFCYTVLGYRKAFESLGFNFQKWPHHVPETMFFLEYILSGVLCLAVGIMLSWHLWSVAVGETSVEAQDHDVYRKVAKGRGDMFVNSYDLGKRKNLALFFNIGETGYPAYTLIFPFRIPPYTDGHAWARREGCEQHLGVRAGDELTDDEGEELETL